ncbi:MAG: outer membrane protein assembly factor BamD [bacterium]|jgi:outer membrane protein assembly factor BamD
MTERLTIVIALVCLCLAGCSGQKSVVPKSPADRLEHANQLKAKEKYVNAVTEYEQVLSEFPAQEIAEAARYHLAECRIGLGDFELARRDLEDFIDSYPKSDLVDNALFLIARSYVEEAPRVERDQTATVKALDELYLLQREYPDTDILDEVNALIAECRSKLAEKEYLSGRLYLRIKSYRAAHIYFDLVVEEYGDTPWAPRALLGKAQTYSKQKDFSGVRETLERVVEEYPGTPESEEAEISLRSMADASPNEESSAE